MGCLLNVIFLLATARRLSQERGPFTDVSPFRHSQRFRHNGKLRQVSLLLYGNCIAMRLRYTTYSDRQHLSIVNFCCSSPTLIIIDFALIIAVLE